MAKMWCVLVPGFHALRYSGLRYLSNTTHTDLIDSFQALPTAKPCKKRLLLIDTMALMFRAHFRDVREPLIRTDGAPIGALWKFASALAFILKQVQPTHAVLCLETRSDDCIRRKLDAAYKSHRPCMPQILFIQLQHLSNLATAIGIASAQVPGYEADDIMASLGRRAEAEGFDEAIIYSPDKDMIQCVTNRVHLWKLNTRGTVDIFDAPELIKVHFHLEPRQWADFLALKGDSADNIAGVEGIGEKTSLAWIKRFDSLDGVLAAAKAGHPDLKPARLVRNLLNAEESLQKYRQLATACCDICMPHFDQYKWSRSADSILASAQSYIMEASFSCLMNEKIANRLISEKALDKIEVDQLDR